MDDPGEADRATTSGVVESPPAGTISVPSLRKAKSLVARKTACVCCDVKQESGKAPMTLC